MSTGHDAHQLWRSTWIWQIIETRCDRSDPTMLTLIQVMPDIEKVLTFGGSSPKDFSLHDAGHAFRVTQEMRELIPDDVVAGLSVNELALLMASAYLHDIGMTPEWGKVICHRNYLVTGGTDGFRGDELELFRVWLAVRGGIHFEPPVKSLQEAEELLTYYCRSRHNDWSAEWISDHFSGLRQTPYPGWIEDLISICRSHHEGFDSLASSGFDPRDLGRDGVVHRRYLAMVLRVADVLENDPERTPDIILRHRVIAASSEPYWQKDHVMYQRIDGNCLTVSAEPQSAILFKAIEENVDQIERELQLCDRLQREKPLGVHPVTGAPSLPHRWVIEPYVVRKIQAPPGKYEYIPSAFRPNTQKVLELLGGQHLYDNQLAAVRELLQNAMDAVNEQIARTQLKRNRTDEEFRALLSREHFIQLRLTTTGKGFRLSCCDSGVGMSKLVIRDQLLVSGQPVSPKLVAFQLECKRAGLRFDRIGQFGIGVLSYFMIAEHVTFKTRPSVESGLEDLRAWEFETWGVGSFGELRPLEHLNTGTEVQLDLRDSFVQSVGKSQEASGAALFGAIAEYGRQTVLNSPCAIELTCAFEGCAPVRLGPGWTRTDDSMRDVLAHWIEHEALKISREIDPSLSVAERDNVLLMMAQAETARDRSRETLRWFGPYEGELPDRLGSFRIMMPFFERSAGAAAAFLSLDEKAGSALRPLLWSQADGFSLNASLAWSIMGISVTLDPLDGAAESLKADLEGHSCSIELDLRDTAGLTVDVGRRYVRLAAGVAQRIRWFLYSKIQTIKSEFMEHHRDSVFARLNARFLGLPVSSGQFWATYDATSGDTKWKDFDFPCTVSDQFETVKTHNGRLGDWRELSCRGRALSICRTVQLRNQWGLHPFERPPDYVVQGLVRFVAPVYVWARPDSAGDYHRSCSLAPFPPAWRSIVGSVLQIRWRHVLLINSGHPLSKFANTDFMPRTAAVLAKMLPNPPRSEVFPGNVERRSLRVDARLAFDWLMACAISGKASEVWCALQDQDADFIPSVFRLLGLETGSSVTVINSVRMFGTTAGVEISEDRATAAPLAPAGDFSPEWHLLKVKDEASAGDTEPQPPS